MNPTSIDPIARAPPQPPTLHCTAARTVIAGLADDGIPAQYRPLTWQLLVGALPWDRLLWRPTLSDGLDMYSKMIENFGLTQILATAAAAAAPTSTTDSVRMATTEGGGGGGGSDSKRQLLQQQQKQPNRKSLPFPGFNSKDDSSKKLQELIWVDVIRTQQRLEFFRQPLYV